MSEIGDGEVGEGDGDGDGAHDCFSRPVSASLTGL